MIWGEAGTGSRHVIGELWRDAASYAFRYADSLDDARARGFFPLLEFPDVGRTYRAGYLFPTFAQRIPSPRRPDYHSILSSWGVDPELRDELLTILARSGGIQRTDKIELAEYRTPDDDLRAPLQMRIAGTLYAAGTDILAPGMLLTLQRVPDNAYDKHAVGIMSGGTRVGWVPRQYSPLVARILDEGGALVTRAVRPIQSPEAKWVVEVSRPPV